MVFLKDLFSDPFSSSYTPLLLVLSYLIYLQIIICMWMILNFSYHSLLLTTHAISLILNILYLMSTTGCHDCHLTFFLSIPLRLSFFLLVFPNNSQNSVILSFIDPPNNVNLSPDHSAPNLEVIFDSNLTFLNTFLLFLNHAFIIFMTADAFEMPLIILQPALLPLLSFILNLTIAILFY